MPFQTSPKFTSTLLKTLGNLRHNLLEQQGVTLNADFHHIQNKTL